MSELVFTVGEALAVFLAQGDGPLAEARGFDRILSGAEVNVAAGLVQEGQRARLVTRVGADALGDAVVADLARLGIDAHVGRDTSRPTGVLIRTAGGADRGEAVHLRRGAAAEGLTVQDVDDAWTDDVAAVLITGITLVRSASAAQAVERAVELGRTSGAVIVADPNLRPALAGPAAFAAALAPLRGRADIAIGDPEELALLAGTGIDTAVQHLLSTGCHLVVTKLGADGAVATDRDGKVHRVGSLVEPDAIVDTIGAGDAFTAGLLAAILDGASTDIALERGSRRAAAVVRTRGDIAESEEVR